MKEVTALMRGGNVGKQVTKIARRYMKKFNDRRGLVANAQGKIECLKKVVPSIQAADRTIIFSQTKDAAEKAVNTLLQANLNAKVFKLKPNLSDKEIDEVAKLKFSGWGRLSKAFLTEILHIDKAM